MQLDIKDIADKADMIINGDVTALDDYLARYLANQMKGV